MTITVPPTHHGLPLTHTLIVSDDCYTMQLNYARHNPDMGQHLFCVDQTYTVNYYVQRCRTASIAVASLPSMDDLALALMQTHKYS